jgi:hypothetical protein
VQATTIATQRRIDRATRLAQLGFAGRIGGSGRRLAGGP